jgi:hypothetical protein
MRSGAFIFPLLGVLFSPGPAVMGDSISIPAPATHDQRTRNDQIFRPRPDGVTARAGLAARLLAGLPPAAPTPWGGMPAGAPRGPPNSFSKQMGSLPQGGYILMICIHCGGQFGKIPSLGDKPSARTVCDDCAKKRGIIGDMSYAKCYHCPHSICAYAPKSQNNNIKNFLQIECRITGERIYITSCPED